MRFITRLLERQPLLAAILALVCCFLLAATLRNWALLATGSQDIAENASRLGAALLIAAGLARYGFGEAMGLTRSPARWGAGWSRTAASLSLIALATLLADQVEWSQLEVTAARALLLLLRTFSTGAYEEVMVRGALFLILVRAWGGTRAGLIRAAALQALLFGALHLTGLSRSDGVYVAYQCCFATLVGYGFAGLTVQARSLWPAILLHGAINTAGNLDFALAGPGYRFAPLTPLTMTLVIGVFFVCGALPGHAALKRARLA